MSGTAGGAPVQVLKTNSHCGLVAEPSPNRHTVCAPLARERNFYGSSVTLAVFICCSIRSDHLPAEALGPGPAPGEPADNGIWVKT